MRLTPHVLGIFYIEQSGKILHMESSKTLSTIGLQIKYFFTVLKHFPVEESRKYY